MDDDKPAAVGNVLLVLRGAVRAEPTSGRMADRRARYSANAAARQGSNRRSIPSVREGIARLPGALERVENPE
jgi:hypothetical protein